MCIGVQLTVLITSYVNGSVPNIIIIYLIETISSGFDIGLVCVSKYQQLIWLIVLYLCRVNKKCFLHQHTLKWHTLEAQNDLP